MKHVTNCLYKLKFKENGKRLFGEKGQIFEVWLEEELLVTSWSPEFVACRILKSRRIEGYVKFWWPGEATHALGMSIDCGASHCVIENRSIGPIFGKYVPYPNGAKNDGNDDAETL